MASHLSNPSSSKSPYSVLIFVAGALVGAIGVTLAQRKLEKKLARGDGNDSASRSSNEDDEESNRERPYHPAPRRRGAAIRLKPGMYRRYRELHDAVWPQVLDRMAESHIRNFTIYYHAETSTLFQHFEWMGHCNHHAAAPSTRGGGGGPESKRLTAEEERSLFEADMQAIANDPVTRRWWKECEPCQEPFSQWQEGTALLSDGGTGSWWAPLECVAHCGYWPVAFASQQRDPDFELLV